MKELLKDRQTVSSAVEANDQKCVQNEISVGIKLNFNH